MDDFEHPQVRRLRSLKAAERRIAMGQVLEMRIEMTEAAFLEAWKKECAEWTELAKWCEEWHQKGYFLNGVTAHTVSEEQRKRAMERGEKLLDMPRIYITGKGWLIPR